MSVNIQGRPFPVPPSSGAPGLLEAAPAVYRTDWIPEGAFAELDELRNEQLRLREAGLEVAREIDALRERFEREDATHAEAARAQAMGMGVELPELTPPAERAAELASLEAKAKAIHEAREEHARRAVETITAKYDEWAAELDSRDAEAEQRVEEARRALAEAEAALGATVQLRIWLGRTAGRDGRRWAGLDGRHIACSDLSPSPEALARPPVVVEPIEGSAERDLSPEARAQLLAARAARHDATNEEDTNG